MLEVSLASPSATEMIDICDDRSDREVALDRGIDSLEGWAMSAAEDLHKAQELLASDGAMEAIAFLVDVNRRAPSVEIERYLLELRRLAYEEEPRKRDPQTREALAAQCQARFAAASDPFPDVLTDPPEVPLSEMNAEVVRGAIRHHGCLIVRGFASEARTERLARYTRLTAETASKHAADPSSEPDEWYKPFEDPRIDSLSRDWTRSVGTLFAADCPRVFFELIDAYREVGFDRLTAEYYGEPTAISAQRSAVRRVTPESLREQPGAIWHQDGQILGDGARALNVWIAITEAGVRGPGLKVVPRRFDGFVPSGVGSTLFDWCVGEESVKDVAGDRPPVLPIFAAGDAIIFDEFFLHTGCVNDAMSEDRLSSETWFFPHSCLPEESLVPLAL